MPSFNHAVKSAAGVLQQISETTAGERGRRAAVVAMVLRAVDAELAGDPGAMFLRRRCEVVLAGLTGGAEPALLRRILLGCGRLESEGGGAAVAEGLVTYGYELEVTGRVAEADAVLTLARQAAPEDAEVALHAGRVARQQGDRARALELYREARRLAGGRGVMSRLGAVGEAAVSDDPEAALTGVIRTARRWGEDEAAAVAFEERSHLRRARGAGSAAAGDLRRAAECYDDPIDRARVAHRLADLYVAGDDPLAAREALLLALDLGDEAQRSHARGRLHTVARDLGDEVGTRRWRSFGRPALVSLSGRPRRRVRRSDAERVAGWREALAIDPSH